MKPIITDTDYNTLKSVVLHLSPTQKTKEVVQLMEELTRVRVIKDKEITPDVIRIDSYFEVAEENGKHVFKFTLTLPSNANIMEKKISVLSPLGIALIGFKEGMTIDCALPAQNKKFKILKVVNQSK